MRQTRSHTLPRYTLRAALLTLMMAGPAVAESPVPTRPADSAVGLPAPTTCSLSSQVQSLRRALKGGSPALQRYLRRQLRELAPSIPEAELRSAFEHESDPAMIAELSGALAARMARLTQPQALRAPLLRAQNDPDPAARAAALRGLRGTATVEAMATLGVDYQQLIRDPAPEVRKAVVGNLLSESAEVYFGHDRAVSEKAIAVALTAGRGPGADPAQSARLLSGISTEKVGPGAVSDLLALLAAPPSENPPELRAAIVTALGGVPASEAESVRTALLAHYRQDRDRDVRRAVLEALCHLSLAAALPLLDSLQSIDSSLLPDIAAWRRALQTGLQEWSLVRREKERILPSPTAPPSSE